MSATNFTTLFKPPMIIRFFVLSIVLSIIVSATAQDATSYELLKDDSILKKQYFDISMKKKEQLLRSVGKEYAKDYKEIYELQFTEIGKLWSSSRPITSTTTNNYLQSIVKKIIDVNPELQGNDARIVFSRDWWPNAVSMGDGSIVINAGLVTGMDNEAEIVFVICHELAHYYLEHTQNSIRKVVTQQNSEEFKKEVKRLSKEQYRVNEQYNKLFNSISFDSRRHSRENEAEADRFAFHFLKNTGYSADAINTCLIKLDRIDDSLLTAPLYLERVFNFTSYPFNNKWVKEESSIFSGINKSESTLTKEEKDSLKTHPECSKRMEWLADSITKISGQGKNFLVDSVYFNSIRKDFALEIMEQCYRDENLSRNLYFAIEYLNRHPDNPVAVYNIGRALNDLYMLQRDHKMGYTIDPEKRTYSPEYNRLLKMLVKIRLSELGDLAYYFIRQYDPVMKGYPGYQDLLVTAIENRRNKE
ncbi:MAG: M48 family metallopeptidase [Chitinophagaceae bacterium]